MEHTPLDAGGTPTSAALAANPVSASAAAPHPRLLYRCRTAIAGGVRNGLADPRRLAGWGLLIVVLGAGVWMCSWRLYGWHHLCAGKQSLDHDHYRKALEQLQAALWAWPDDPEVLFLAARAARRAGELGAAEHYLGQCQAAPALADRAPLERVLLRATRGEMDAVAAYCRSLLERGDPDTPLILEALAQGYSTALRFPEASACLDDWLMRMPDHPQALYVKGRLELQASNRPSAIKLFNRVLELDAERDDARLFLAELYLELGQGHEALPHLELLAQHLPGHPLVNARLGRCLVMLGRKDQAIRILDGVLQRQPDLAPALLERGKLALDDDDLPLAADLLRKACARDPGDRSTYYQLFLCLERQGKAAEAKTVQQRMRDLEQDTARLHEIATKELSQRPRDAGLYVEAGEIFLRVGAFDEGVRWLETAVQIAPQHAGAHRALARHYQARGQFGLAQQHRAMADVDRAPLEKQKK
jgi:tetratricopeptide (TPR) repeat protein